MLGKTVNYLANNWSRRERTELAFYPSTTTLPKGPLDRSTFILISSAE